MEIQNAIEILKTHNNKCSGCDKLCNDLCKPAVELAISALEKQTPKRPEFIHMLGNSTYKAKCICRRVFTANIDIDSNPKYCSGCGQAFDWSE